MLWGQNWKSCTRKGTTKLFHRSVALGFANLLIAFFERVGFQTLPRQAATQEVEKHVTKSLHVVSPTLFCVQSFKTKKLINYVHNIIVYSQNISHNSKYTTVICNNTTATVPQWQHHKQYPSIHIILIISINIQLYILHSGGSSRWRWVDCPSWQLKNIFL